MKWHLVLRKVDTACVQLLRERDENILRRPIKNYTANIRRNCCKASMWNLFGKRVTLTESIITQSMQDILQPSMVITHRGIPPMTWPLSGQDHSHGVDKDSTEATALGRAQVCLTA